MENIINYYYGLVILNIEYRDEYYLIKTSDDEYLLSQLHESVDELKEIIDILNNTNIMYHLLVYTKDNELSFNYEDKDYVLLKKRDVNNPNINDFTKIILPGKTNWGTIWSNRMDYYETQVNEVVNNNDLKYIMNYYMSLTEMCILFFNNLEEIFDEKEKIYSISHFQNNSPIDINLFYNPANMFIDLNIRDLAEYIKISFFDDILGQSEILNIVDHLVLNNSMANYFFLRLIYPSYIFKLFDNYIETKEITPQLDLYIKKNKDYESLLSNVYNRLIINHDIKANFWFIKVQHL